MGVKKQSSRFSKDPLRQIEGRNPVREALRAGTPITRIIVEEQMKLDDRLDDIFRLSREKHISLERIASKKLKKISKTGGHHQGVIAYAAETEEPDLEDILLQLDQDGVNPFFLVLPEVLYEQNLGAMIRTAEACRIHGVLVSNRMFGKTPIVTHTSMGASEYVPLIHTNIFSTIKDFRRRGTLVIGTDQNANRTIYDLDLTRGVALVMGSEDTGISEPVEKLLDCTVSIPMLGQIESLNMSVAAGICMHEVIRQRRHKRESVI